MPGEGTSWADRFNGFYQQLDALITAEEKDKTAKELTVWAGEVNRTLLGPCAQLFQERYGAEPPVKVQELDPKAKKKDDHLKRLKANRYALYTFQRKEYLESVGDLS